LAGLALCPASTLLTRSWEQMAGWTNLGAVTMAGHDTWHLHAEQVQSQDNQTAGNQVDLYVDRTSHFLIRSRTEQTMAGSSPSSYVTTTTFSRFNVPLAIKPPS